MKVIAHWLKTRARKIQPTTIVLHASAGASAESSINWLEKIGLSYHYIIERDGTVTKLAPVGRVAFHAGVSHGPNGSNVNDYSIGICFANRNNGEVFPNVQVDAAHALVNELTQTMPSLKYITTHYLVSPGRKNDPYRFKFETFSSKTGLSAWRPNAKAKWDLQ